MHAIDVRDLRKSYGEVAAVERVGAEFSTPDDITAELMAYFVPAAEHLRNDSGLPISTSRTDG